MSYATPTELTYRYSSTLLGQLASDSTSAVDPTASSIVQTCLDDAAGQIEAALLRGQRYSLTDLQNLTANSLNLLKRINCDGAFVLLWERKPSYAPDDIYERSANHFEKMLKRLADGEDIFNLTSTLESGVPEITGPTTVEYQQLNLIAGQARGHFYPQVRLPFNR